MYMNSIVIPAYTVNSNCCHVSLSMHAALAQQLLSYMRLTSAISMSQSSVLVCLRNLRRTNNLPAKKLQEAIMSAVLSLAVK